MRDTYQSTHYDFDYFTHRQVHNADDIENEHQTNLLEQHSCLLKSRWYQNAMSYILGELRFLEFSTM